MVSVASLQIALVNSFKKNTTNLSYILFQKLLTNIHCGHMIEGSAIDCYIF